VRRIAPTLVAALCLLFVPASSQAARAWTSVPASAVGVSVNDAAFAVTQAGERVALYTVPSDPNAPSAPVVRATVVKPAATSGQDSVLQAGGWGQSPAVASGGGSTIAAWESGPGVEYSIRPDGGAFTAAQTLPDASGSFVLRMNARGDAALLYTYYEYHLGPQVRLAVRPAGAGAFGSPVVVSAPIATDSGNSFTGLGLAVGPGGQIAMAWSQTTSGASVVDVARATMAAVTPGGPQTVSAAGAFAYHPWAAVDGQGDAIVTWVEAPDSNTYWGSLHAVVSASGAAFGSAFAIGGTAGRYEGARVVADPAGNAVVSWGAVTDSGYSGPPMVATVRLPSGAISSPTPLQSDTGVGTFPAVDAAGDAAVAFTDAETGDLRVARRAGGAAAFTAPETAVCARPWTAVDGLFLTPAGDAQVLWSRSDPYTGKNGLTVSSDADASQPSPGSCPAAYVVTPRQPQPGDDVTIDARGSADPDATSTTWRWDLDGDGRYETTETTGVERLYRVTSGWHRIGLEVVNTREGGTWTRDDVVDVYVPGGTSATSASGGDASSGGGYSPSDVRPTASTSRPSQFSSGGWFALPRDMLTSWTPFTIDGLLDQGHADSSFYTNEAGHLSVKWTLQGTHTVLFRGDHEIHRGLNQVALQLTPDGRTLLRRAIYGTWIVGEGSYTANGATTHQQQSFFLSHNWCYDPPADVNCHTRSFGHTDGGRGVGKVSHVGWPSISGVLWIADDSGASGTATPVGDELLGGHGSDTLHGGGGDDVLWGDEWPTGNTAHQHDLLDGGPGNDWLYASHGTNDIVGGPGDDTIWSVYARHAYIDAGSGDDRIVARRGHGTIDCGPGHDTVWVPAHRYTLSNCEEVRHTRPSPFLRLSA
jgi:Ca2+-binding RTX toxin-like protein